MSSLPVPIKSRDEAHLRDSISRSPFSTSFRSGSPIARESLARDLAECPADEVETPEQNECTSSGDESSEASTTRQMEAQHSMTHSYRRPGFVAFGGTRPAVTPQFKDTACMVNQEGKTRVKE
ncbi:hypothetical protein EYC80_001642 [Monilinia laxa]|uniref:Uncharacterized protein n=1 Tax=Monilinia laxa TaxID=61186 RepID=A0A5N6K5N4_MONLA|nr:hypothetical protein EYC80_001642 [Monilinia laxa]